MQKQINQVLDFHKVFNIPASHHPQIPDLDRCILRHDLLQEEVDELADACNEMDIVAVADALTDILYILLGTVHEFGLHKHFERCFDEVHRSNMSKLDEDGRPIYRADGKVLKSKNYSKPDLEKIILPF